MNNPNQGFPLAQAQPAQPAQPQAHPAPLPPAVPLVPLPLPPAVPLVPLPLPPAVPLVPLPLRYGLSAHHSSRQHYSFQRLGMRTGVKVSSQGNFGT